IGNAFVDDTTTLQGTFDYYWTHALNSDETHAGITKNCDFVNGNLTSLCIQYLNQGDEELGNIDYYDIYAPLCNSSAPKTPSPGSVGGYVVEYEGLNFYSNQRMKALQFICVLFCFQHLAFFPIASTANQIDYLNKLITKSRKSENPPANVGNQLGMMEADKIDFLPGQPQGVDFDQYAGYVTVNQTAGRALFYYFVESPNNSLTNPLVLWLNGGPGCSSLGYGAMEELGPFRVNSDGKTLFRNEYSWNNVANVIFLESPAGVGFSYSNTSSDYKTVGDQRTAEDSYVFLINWLERFPQYKSRDFYITGESYAGHYVPQLAYTILSNNKITNQTVINLKGIAIGNPYIDDGTTGKGIYDYYWTHALISDETHAGITRHCDFVSGNFSRTCKLYRNQAFVEHGKLDLYDIYAPLCNSSAPKTPSPGSVSLLFTYTLFFFHYFIFFVAIYLCFVDDDEFHVNLYQQVGWTDRPSTILPTIKQLIDRALDYGL
ncbi:hypothetical protein C3L33_09575, partial [Rhododendron williamsianum]